MGSVIKNYLPYITVLLAIAAPSQTEAGAMLTNLATIKAEATLIVVGTVKRRTSGLSIDVDYAVRGKAKKGVLAVKESPNGHVFVDIDPNKNRVIGFIDGKNRLRWVGRLVAGSSLEEGVIRLEGFFDFNAHIVRPGVMTLSQLEDYLKSDKLVQTFRGG